MPSIDPLDESFWKEEDTSKKQPKKPIAEKDVSSKFNATDFRKREMIFQPRKKRTSLTGQFKSTLITTPKSHKRIIQVHGDIDLESLCKKLNVKKKVMLRKLKEEGVSLEDSKILDFDTVSLLAPSFGFEAKNTKKTEDEILSQITKKPEKKFALSTKASCGHHHGTCRSWKNHSS